MNDTVQDKDSFDTYYQVKRGIALYEVIRIISGKSLFLEDHLERLSHTADLAKLKIALLPLEIAARINKLIQVNGISEGNIKLVINFTGNEQNFIAFFIRHNYPSEEEYRKGIEVISFHGMRQNPNAKIIDWKFRESVNKAIKENHAYEALLVNQDGEITEGSRSNVFFIEGEKVFTPPLKEVLPGVTRRQVISICNELSIPFEEKEIKASDIENIDAMFISGTSPKILPVSLVDGKPFSTDNPVLKRLMEAYNKKIENYILHH
ncbi:MAG: aminotransferase class IV [Bacteroidota bacterium]|nr:aminotransferase class IV [Bacteroidota bacterium]